MEHGGTCGLTCIEEHTKFENVCFANLVSIKRERGTNFAVFLISHPMKVCLGGHNKEKIPSVNR